MKINRIQIVLIIILTILSSCIRMKVASEPMTSNNANHWWTLWLDAPACMPPCWENITPGKTTYAEALAILESLPGIVFLYSDDRIGLEWIFDKNKTDTGEIKLNPDGTVYRIWLGNSSDQKLYLKSVIASFGPPTFVQPYDCREGMCSTALAYPDQGMMLEVFVKNLADDNGHQVKIESNVEIYSVRFFIPEFIEYNNMLMDEKYIFTTKWKGYGTYP